MMVPVYVDDKAVRGANEAREDFHATATKKFPTNNLGKLPWYTRCAVTRDRKLGTIEVTQTTFIESAC